MQEGRTFSRRLAWICAVALPIRVVYVLWYSRRAPLGFDPTHYFELSKTLADDHEYAIAGAHTALFPPGFPTLLALMRVLGFGTRTKLLLGMAGVGTATTALVGVLGRRVSGERVGLIAAAIAAVYPNLFLAEGALMTEALTALLVVAALVLALRAIDRPTLRRFAVFGLPLGYGALTRSDGAVFAVLLVATVAWCAVPSPNYRRRAAMFAAGLAATVVLVGGWLVRDEVQMHAFVPIAVNGWDVLGGANCHSAYYGPRFGSWDLFCLQLEQAQAAGKRGEIDQNRYIRDRGTDYLKAHEGRLPIVIGARLGLTFGAYDPWHELEVESSFEGRDAGVAKVGYVMYLALLPLAAIGFVVLGKGSTRKVLIVPFVAVVASTVVGYGNQRFRMPIEPVLVVLAAIGLEWCRRLRIRPADQPMSVRGADAMKTQ